MAKEQCDKYCAAALYLAEQWKGRADDAGRLARAVLKSTPSHVAQFQLCKDCNWQAACTATRRCDNAPSTTPQKQDRVAACLHACEGLATADLAGNDKGWVTDVITKAAAVEADLEHYRGIVRRQDHGEAYDTQRRINLDLSTQLAEACAAAGIVVNGGGMTLPVWIKAIREQLAGTTPSAIARKPSDTLDFLRDERFTGAFIEEFVNGYASRSSEEQVQLLLDFAVALVGELTGPEFEVFCSVALGPINSPDGGKQT